MKKLFFIFILGLLFISPTAQASHILGGEVTYQCIGVNTYLITFNLYRDCRPPEIGGGSTVAISGDDPINISIFDGSTFYSFDSVYSSSELIIPVNFSNNCVNNIPVVCLNRIRFQIQKTLQPSANGYTILCQRCCRNASINNILNPGLTGATYFCKIPPSNIQCNTSAVFKNYPPQIICVNNPFVYDHSATDADGDSLTYEFCTAYTGGNSDTPKPVIIGGTIPTFSSVNYLSPLTALNPMAGNPQMKIDPITGIITGTPNLQGRFVVNVCCNEWRNGILINTVSREFQFVVTNCSKAVVANIPQYSEEQNTYIVSCKSYTVHFDNTSIGGFKYEWDFGVPSINTDTSTLFEPTFTYPDTGTYVVKLVVNRGSTCPDSISRFVKVYPDFDADFDYKGLLCPDEPIQFFDKSTSTFKPINFWSWDFGDGNYSSIQNPDHIFSNLGKIYNVTMISGNKYGCLDTASKILNIPYVDVFAGNDTVIVVNTPFQFHGTGAKDYEWSPTTQLDNPFVYNPNATYTDTGKYTYVLQGITANGCVGYDTINVVVATGPYLNIPNAFSPNGDGMNDYFNILAAGFKKLNYYRIFNRWGEQVYYTNNFRKGWDGKFKGRDCEVGTYFWTLSAVGIDNKEKMIKGDVTLLR